MESIFFEFSFLNLKNNPSVKGKRLKTMMRSYLKAYPSALNANKNSEDEMLIMLERLLSPPLEKLGNCEIKCMLSPNEKTNNIIISDAPDNKVKVSYFKNILLTVLDN